MFSIIRKTLNKILCKISKIRRDRKKEIDEEAEKLVNGVIEILEECIQSPGSDVNDIFEFKSPKQ